MVRRISRPGWLMGLATAVAAVAFAAACGAAEPSPTQQPATPAPAPTAAPVQQPTQAPAQPATPVPAPTAAPQPTTPTQPSGPVTQSGDVVWAVNEVNAMIGDPALGPYRDWEQSEGMGITEALFVYENGDPMSPHLATSWEVAPDGSKVTITIRQGVKWNSPPGVTQDFGELTAEDVVWFLNRQNSYTNPESTSGDAGDFKAVFKDARLIDKYKLEIDLQSPTYYGLPLSEFGVLGAAPSIRSKAVFDKMGRDWMIDHAVGTGPFVQKEWVANDRGVVEALPQHWRDTATIKTFTKIQVPENSSRVAMLKTGRADLAAVDFKLVPGLTKEGLKFIETMPGGYVGVSVIYSGNLWEEKNPITGVPLSNDPKAPGYADAWALPGYQVDYPWIGNPWGDRVPYQDTNNPSGMDDMEQARLVRLALGMAIDRQSIVDVLLGGLGTPIYSEYMGPLYPGWDPNRQAKPVTYDAGEPIANPGPTQQPVPWELEYDPDMAKQLLATAGFPNGFEMTLNAYVCEIGEACLEVADIVTSAWSQLGLKITQSREDYGGVISPRMRKREQVNPVVKNGDVNSNQFPLDWPYPPVDSSLSRPGWGVAFETPVLAKNHLDIRASKDKAFREQKHLETADYILYWQLYNGIIQIPKGVIATNRIQSWASRPAHYGTYGTPQFIRLAGR